MSLTQCNTICLTFFSALHFGWCGRAPARLDWEPRANEERTWRALSQCQRKDWWAGGMVGY